MIMIKQPWTLVNLSLALLVSCLLLHVMWAQDVAQDSCGICMPKNANQDTPRLFHRPNGAGVGNLVYSMIHGAAYAKSREWVYGGPLGIEEKDVSTVNFIFSAGDYFTLSSAELKYISTKKQVKKASDLPEITGPPWESNIISVQMDDWGTFEKKCKTEEFPRFRMSENVPVINQLFPPAFLAQLQKTNQVALSAVPLLYKTNGRQAPRVAIHIRRGGLTKGAFSARKHTPDSYYYSMIELVRNRYPKAEFHGFPSLGKKDESPPLNQTAFAGYVKRNVTLHFEADTVTAWAHMIAADVLIMAHSVYSSVPALLNRNCVVYDPFWFGKLDRYLTIHTLKEKFNECCKADPIARPTKAPGPAKGKKFQKVPIG